MIDSGKKEIRIGNATAMQTELVVRCDFPGCNTFVSMHAVLKDDCTLTKSDFFNYVANKFGFGIIGSEHYCKKCIHIVECAG